MAFWWKIRLCGLQWTCIRYSVMVCRCYLIWVLWIPLFSSQIASLEKMLTINYSGEKFKGRCHWDPWTTKNPLLPSATLELALKDFVCWLYQEKCWASLSFPFICFDKVMKSFFSFQSWMGSILGMVFTFSHGELLPSWCGIVNLNLVGDLCNTINKHSEEQSERGPRLVLPRAQINVYSWLEWGFMNIRVFLKAFNFCLHISF